MRTSTRAPSRLAGRLIFMSFLVGLGAACGDSNVTFHDDRLNDPDAGAAAGWDVQPSSMFQSGECRPPSCDRDAGVDYAVGGTWRRILQTTGTNCGDLIRSTDDRAKEGARGEKTETIPALEGTCLFHDGERVGTVRRNTMARCIAVSRRQGVTSYSTEVVSFDGDVGTGRVRTYLRGVPAIAGGDCRIDRDIRYERR